MNYKDINDYELLFMVQEQEELAEEILYKKYYYIIKSIVNKYEKVFSIYNIDAKDLYQESLIAFYDAINNYKDNCNSSFKTFLSLCIRRRLNKVIRELNTIKKKIQINTLLIDDFEETQLNNLLTDHNINNPLNLINNKEIEKENDDLIKKKLSMQEYKVYKCLINGLSIGEISNILNLTYKSVSLTINRIKNKLIYFTYNINS